MYCPGQGFKPESTKGVSRGLESLVCKDKPEEVLGRVTGDV
jgi:hypothetical protein